MLEDNSVVARMKTRSSNLRREDSVKGFYGLDLRKKSSVKIGIFVLLAAAVLYLLYVLSQQNYLLFHSSVEIFTVVIAFAAFTIAWNSRRIMDNKYALFVGIAFLFVGFLDLLHTLTYKNMNVFSWIGVHPNVATQLWIAMRYFFSFSVLSPLFFVRRKIRLPLFLAVCTATTALIVTSIFYWQNFPVAYVDGVGLTPFKVASEYAISLILIVAIGLLYKKRKEFSSNVFKLLMAAMVTAVA